MFKTIWNVVVNSVKSEPEWAAKCLIVVSGIAGGAIADSMIQRRKVKDIRNALDYTDRQLWELIENHKEEE